MASPNFKEYTKMGHNFHVKPECLIGKGSYGKVYSVVCYEDGKSYAMKVLNIKDQSYSKFAMWEVDIGRLIKVKELDQYLVGIHLATHIDDTMYLIMDKYQTDLWRLMRAHHRDTPMDLLQVRNIGIQLLTAADLLHNLNIIHTDIKPENILVVGMKNGFYRIKLGDFGTSIKAGTYKCCPTIQSLFYRAPEILFGLPFDNKIDTWSIGCIMAEMYIGIPFYPAHNEEQLAYYIATVQGYPYDLFQSKFWDKYFTRQLKRQRSGPTEELFYLKNDPKKQQDRRLTCFSKIDEIIQYGLTYRKENYFSVLDVQFIKDLNIMMNVDRDFRCTAEEARSLSIFHLENHYLQEETNSSERQISAIQ